MTTLENLREARALISDERDWWDGKPEPAVRHCAITAIVSVTGGLHQEGWEKQKAAGRAMGLRPSEIISFNDTHTHAEVLELFDHAIARLEEQESGEKPCPISDTSTSSRPSLVPA